MCRYGAAARQGNTYAELAEGLSGKVARVGDVSLAPDSGRAVWTDADFATMGWHDSTVYGLSVLAADEGASRLALDIDYIFRWVHPEPPERAFQFWVAPATLVFDRTYELEIDIDMGPFQGLKILDMTREELHDQWGGFRWTIEGLGFGLTLPARGYRQISRRAPVLGGQVIDLAQRGGVSFDEAPYATD